jgi:hypothetical protein
MRAQAGSRLEAKAIASRSGDGLVPGTSPRVVLGTMREKASSSPPSAPDSPRWRAVAVGEGEHACAVHGPSAQSKSVKVCEARIHFGDEAVPAPFPIALDVGQAPRCVRRRILGVVGYFLPPHPDPLP